MGNTTTTTTTTTKKQSMKTVLAFTLLLSARMFIYSSFTVAFIGTPAKDASFVKSATKRRTADIFNPIYKSNKHFYASYSSDDMLDDEKGNNVCRKVGLSEPPCGNNECCVKIPGENIPRCMKKRIEDSRTCHHNCQCKKGSTCQNRKCKKERSATEGTFFSKSFLNHFEGFFFLFYFSIYVLYEVMFSGTLA